MKQKHCIYCHKETNLKPITFPSKIVVYECEECYAKSNFYVPETNSVVKGEELNKTFICCGCPCYFMDIEYCIECQKQNVNHPYEAIVPAKDGGGWLIPKYLVVQLKEDM